MKYIYTIIFSLITVIGFTQDNLVPNSTFEKIEKKIKDKGEISVAIPWTSPTLSQADLYVPKTKNYNISIPENSYGEEKPMKGSGYAGIIGYSYKNKVPRSYLQVKLTGQLEERKSYCVKYHVSLADLSKYSCNHLGVAITSTAITANNSDVLKFESHIESRKLKIYETQFYWTPICGIFNAKGGEEYLTIGNFTDDKDLQTKKVKRPRGFTKPQTYDAYYYIDNVSVTVIEGKDRCDCDAIPGMENNATVKKGFSSDKDINTKTLKIINTDGSSITNGKTDSTPSSNESSMVEEDEKIDGMVVRFSESEFSIDAFVGKLDKVAVFMNENLGAHLTITGYIDESESGVEKLAGKRVGAVYKYLLSKGLTKDQVDRSIGGTENPIDKKDKSKNMRVEFSVITE